MRDQRSKSLILLCAHKHTRNPQRYIIYYCLTQERVYQLWVGWAEGDDGTDVVSFSRQNGQKEFSRQFMKFPGVLTFLALKFPLAPHGVGWGLKSLDFLGSSWHFPDLNC